MAKSKKPKQYRLSDLIAIAEQLGGRIRLDIVPVELCQPPTPQPEEPKP